INVSATSNKTLQEIIYEITRVLQTNNIPHYYDGNSTFECECLDNKSSLRFQIEICHIPRLASYGLHFKRLYGGVWNYKKICTKLLSQMSI
ncbi:kinase associated domain 1-containing protein, partial [Piromyces finnis]